MSIIKENGVLILDFGSQYTQLIARRIREENVFSEVVPCDMPLLDIIEKKPRALILSGGPSSIYDGDRPKFDLNILNSKIPTLGICYGLHLLVQNSGGEVEKSNYGEYGLAKIHIQKKSRLLNNIPSNILLYFFK